MLFRSMDEHPEINWSEVARQAIREKLRDLRLMEELVEGSELTEEDVDELAARIDREASSSMSSSVSSLPSTSSFITRRSRIFSRIAWRATSLQLISG